MSEGILIDGRNLRHVQVRKRAARLRDLGERRRTHCATRHIEMIELEQRLSDEGEGTLRDLLTVMQHELLQLDAATHNSQEALV